MDFSVLGVYSTERNDWNVTNKAVTMVKHIGNVYIHLVAHAT